MTSSYRIVAIALLSCAPFPAIPCSHSYYPVDYIVSGAGERALAMPQADFFTELRDHFAPSAESAVDRDMRAKRRGETYAAQRAELREIIEKSSLNAESVTAVTEAYGSYLNKMRRPELENQRPVWRDGRFVYLELDQALYVPTPLEDFPVLVHFLPKEFELYLRGAANYHAQRYKEAKAFWDELLALPANQRHHRSTWAAFMCGRAAQKLGATGAIPYFEQTRALAAEGFPDRLDLATSSLGWQALSELRAKNYAESAAHYVQLFQTGGTELQKDAYLSLRLLCKRLFAEPDALEAAASNPIAQEVITLWLLSTGNVSENSTRWVETLRTIPLDQPPVDAGRMAWLAYDAGDFELANGWIGLASPQDFAARWVEAKLMMRAGKLAEPAQLLANLDLTNAPYYVFEYDDEKWHYGDKSLCRPIGDLALLLLNQGHYEQAFDVFVQGDYARDAEALGNYVLSISEHKSAIDRVTSNEPLVTEDLSDPRIVTGMHLRISLAQRLFRDGDFAVGAPYHCAPWTAYNEKANGRWIDHSLAKTAEMFASAMEQGRSKSESGIERGLSVLRAADIARGCGMTLFGGGHTGPLNYVQAWQEDGGSLPIRSDGVTKEVKRRIETNAPSPQAYRPYGNHRYFTADLYWEAATLLPDNHAQTAESLWKGGNYLAAKDPDAADKFYKALVRRCRKLPIGQDADQRRWFPPEPNSWTEGTDALEGGHNERNNN